MQQFLSEAGGGKVRGVNEPDELEAMGCFASGVNPKPCICSFFVTDSPGCRVSNAPLARLPILLAARRQMTSRQFSSLWVLPLTRSA